MEGLVSNQPPKCQWTLDSGPEYEVWESACGEMWQFETDGPTRNRMRFCCYCGKPLEEVRPTNDDDEQ